MTRINFADYLLATLASNREYLSHWPDTIHFRSHSNRSIAPLAACKCNHSQVEHTARQIYWNFLWNAAAMGSIGVSEWTCELRTTQINMAKWAENDRISLHDNRKKNIRNNKWLASAHASTRIHRNKLHDRKFYRYSLWHQHTRSKYKKYIYSYAIFLLSSVVFSIHWRVFCSLPQSAIELHSHWLGCVVRRGICVKRICVCMYCGHGHVCLCHRQND